MLPKQCRRGGRAVARSQHITSGPFFDQGTYLPDDFKANYDNNTNINFGRLVPRP